MDELGHILREARDTRGLTLSEVQEQTRISQRYLEALEMGDYDLLPSPVHVRGFLRNYARFLNLDPEPLLERYELGQSQRPRKKQPPQITNPVEPVAPPVSTLPQEQIFFDPVNMEVDAGYARSSRGSGINSDSVVRLLIIGALLVLIFLAAQRFIPLLRGEGDGTEAMTESFNQLVEDVMSGGESESEDMVEEDTAVTDPEATPDLELQPSSVLTSTSRNDPLAVDQPTPTRPDLPATMEQIELVVDVLERAWLEVTIDGNVVFSGIARPDGEPLEWTADDEAKILTGNAAGVYVTINGIELGRLGERGENAEESWQTTN